MILNRLLLTILLPIALYANQISWLGDYNKALQLAQKEHKPLMVLLVKKNCPKCNQFIVKNFMNKPYIKRLNKEFICTIVTFDAKASYPIEMLYSTIFPKLFFIDSQRELPIKKPSYLPKF